MSYIFAAIYHVASGIISQVVGGEEADIAAMPETGFDYVEVTTGVTDVNSYIKAGAVYTYPAKPDPDFGWDLATETWVDTRSLSRTKARRRKQAQAERDAIVDSNIIVAGHEYQADPVSRTHIAEYMVRALSDSTFTVDFILADNTTTLLDAAGLEVVYTAITDRTATTYARCIEVYDAIIAASTLAEVDAIVF